ncbi:MAG: hypothetical protein JO257_21905, partial [Deltaproteobacteria bacterium]|nr:hypothetical protein [Deltaproteobacteria bacterium]
GDSAGESTTVEAPLCILRPLLSPTSEAAFAGSLTAAQVKKLHDVRQLLTNLINTVELPYRFPGPGFPYGDCEISGIKATVHDIHVSTDATKNLVELTINFDQSTFTVCFDNRHDVDTDGSWAIHIFFAPFVGPRLNSGLDAATAYSGVTFTLVDVQVTGELDTPGPDVDLSFLDDQLTEALRPFANQTIAGIMLTAGSLRTDPNNGLLDLPDVTSCIVRDPAHVLGLPHQCPIGGIPQIWTTRVDNGLVMNYEALCP